MYAYRARRPEFSMGWLSRTDLTRIEPRPNLAFAAELVIEKQNLPRSCMRRHLRAANVAFLAPPAPNRTVVSRPIPPVPGHAYLRPLLARFRKFELRHYHGHRPYWHRSGPYRQRGCANWRTGKRSRINLLPRCRGHWHYWHYRHRETDRHACCLEPIVTTPPVSKPNLGTEASICCLRADLVNFP